MKSDQRKLEEIRDRRRWLVERGKDQGPAPKPNWQRAREEGEHARVQQAMELRQKLGLSTTDKEIRDLARKRTEDATRRAMRDEGEG